MSYQETYQNKVVAPEQAAKVVKSGDWVDFGWCACTPVLMDQAIAARWEELTDVNFMGGILMRPLQIFQTPEQAERFTWNSWHMGGIERKMIASGNAFYGALRYSELPRYYRENVERVDVAVFQVSSMDNHGYFSFGPSASHMRAVCDRATTIIVEVNPNIPRCLGGFEESIHIDEVSMVVESTEPIACMGAAGEASDVDKAVAQLIVEEIPNGACLQLGIGGMPNAVGSMIASSDLRDLGVHTEMYVDGFVDMAAAGKITGACKVLDRGRQTYAFAAGSQKLYDYLDNNPACMAASVGYTNDVRSISQQPNFTSINNAVNIDLFGQVNAESAGLKQISGAGGQLDFVLGAYLAQGGKSFICLSSSFTDKKGNLQSRILPTLAEGSIVTDARPNVHYVVTEYGKVNLKGQSSWQRAEKLISIAHPAFRDQLIADAEKANIWRKSNKR